MPHPFTANWPHTNIAIGSGSGSSGRLRVLDVEEGGQISLECRKPASAVRVEWSRERNLPLSVQSYFEDDSLMLIIPRIKLADGGTYYCTAIFPDGNSAPSSTVLNVMGERLLTPSPQN